MSGLKWHPAANLFPLLEGEAFKALVDDIREHGQREPVLLAADGSILDGRNRARACKALGIDPVTQPANEGESPVEYVVSLNLHRRHLTQSQKAVIAADVAKRLKDEAKARQLAGLKQNAGTVPETVSGTVDAEGEPTVPERFPERGQDPHDRESRERAGVIVGVSGRYVGDAANLPPDLAEAVLKGDLSLPQAKAALNQRTAPPPPSEGDMEDVLDRHDPDWRSDKARADVLARWDKAITAITALATEKPADLLASVPWDRIESGTKSMAHLASWAEKHLSKPDMRLIAGGSNA